MHFLPTVIEKLNNVERAHDIYSYLLKNRIIFLNGEIDDISANIVCAQLIFLESQDPESDVHLYINSPGGCITSGLAIYDTMQFIQPDVQTWGIGLAASCGSFLLCSGAKNKRNSLLNTRIMVHEPSGGFKGRSIHIEDHANEVVYLRNLLINLYSKHSSQDEKLIMEWFKRESFFNSNEAKNLGLIDNIFEHRKLLHKI